MSILNKEVQVGKFYVNGWSVREIFRDLGDQVSYYKYDLNTGEAYSRTTSQCSKRHITRWAEREATSEEIHKLKLHDARTQEEKFSKDIAKDILRSIPDEWLLSEVERRGL